MNKIDYSQYPNKSIPVYYSLNKGFLTYIGTIIPKSLGSKIYLMSPKQASQSLDLELYQKFLEGDITLQDRFVHKSFGTKIDFTKVNRAILFNLREGKSEQDIPELFRALLRNFPRTVKMKPSEISKEDKFLNTELGYRFDLDF